MHLELGAIGAASHVESWPKKPPSTTAWKFNRFAAEAIATPSQRPHSRQRGQRLLVTRPGAAGELDTGSPAPVVVAAPLGSSPGSPAGARGRRRVSRQPRLPHAHGRPPGSTVVCPNSPPNPC